MEFFQVDVFGDQALSGNALAVVRCEKEFPSTEWMQRFASFQNLSETVFVGPSLVADYKVRIFVVDKELPFAGYVVLVPCF
jgi:trans-2,3-dihydro-3-hydroxyanthranilate isomerase